MHPLFKSLQDGVRALKLDLPETTLNRLLQYQDQLVLWNKAFNLTAIRDPKEMLVRHLLDSLSIIPHLPKGRLLDIGTGGGMPGFIIALVEPERECVLLDSNGKKIRFLRQVSADMKVTNANPIQSRVEDNAIFSSLGQFEVVTSRAFASLNDFVNLGQPFLAPNGCFAAMKGVVPVDELAQLEQYQQQVIGLQVPHLNEQRHLILLT
ncbi:16S rRNA (guanine(527)-N(7))-methyltransferase RsmG [Alkanindiges sp. WGS2144]|uniref:16S rRNA (guanine(527)-N(7))-methyltransferase RsmG n=1 Tax=Alkanindiges sp. WGS2144 TaxID=3366808 RepID=UPI003750B062